MNAPQRQRLEDRKRPKAVYTPPADLVKDLFTCPRLRARFTRTFCVYRQKRQPVIVGAAQLIRLYTWPEDVYCRSGACALGKLNAGRKA